jgi:hypothetical protein
MDESFARTHEDLAERGFRYTKEQFDAALHQAEDYVREKPGQSLFYAFVVGYVLNRLPLGLIVGGMFRLLRLALKPAILIYGASKLYQATQEEEL